MNPLLLATVGYVAIVALASGIGVSFVNGRVNAILALTTWLALALLVVAGVSLAAKRMRLRLLLRLCVAAVAAVLCVPLAGIIGFVVALSSLAAPDYQEEVNGLVCRGSTFGNATVGLNDERTEVAVFRPISTMLERRLGTRSWQGHGGTPFTGFENECTILHAQHGG